MRDEKEYLGKIDGICDINKVRGTAEAIVMAGQAIAYAIIFLGRCYMSK
jgi:hypothetical protein